jgi:CRISPR-associated protein Csb1
MSQNITLGELETLVEKDADAIRGRAILDPAGGPGDKVLPPSHSVDEERADSKYAFETRRRNGNNSPGVLIDSIQSQANPNRRRDTAASLKKRA